MFYKNYWYPEFRDLLFLFKGNAAAEYYGTSILYTQTTVISSASNALITCFPGEYTPAFVSDWMSDREKTLSKMFWEQHLFKKYN